MADADAMVEQYRRELDEGKSQAKRSLGLIGNKHTVDWSKYHDADWNEAVPTGVRIEQLRELRPSSRRLPSNFTLHRQVARIVQDREKMAAGQLPLDWGFAETLAYATLLTEGFECGSPARTAAAARSSIVTPCGTTRTAARRTSRSRIWRRASRASRHRFAAVGRSGDGLRVRLLDHRAELPDDLGSAVRRLRNGAQVIIDQFISSGEAKWGRCAASRCCCRTATKARAGALLRAPRAFPAAVRRAQHAGVRAVDARADVPHAAAADEAGVPQAAHRHDAEEPAASQAVGVAARGSDARLFRTVIDEVDDIQPAKVTRVVFCSGKVYFDLLESRRADGCTTSRSCASSSCIRSRPSTRRSIRKYAQAHEIVWCQEEPQNQGAWYQIRHRLQEPLSREHRCCTQARAGRRAGDRHPADAHGSAEGLVDAALRSTSAEERCGRPAACVRPGEKWFQEKIMSIEVKVPQLPESVTDATLVAWHKKPASRRPRREPGRPGDRQGRAGSAGAGRGRDQEPRSRTERP